MSAKKRSRSPLREMIVKLTANDPEKEENIQRHLEDRLEVLVDLRVGQLEELVKKNKHKLREDVLARLEDEIARNSSRSLYERGLSRYSSAPSLLESSELKVKDDDDVKKEIEQEVTKKRKAFEHQLVTVTPYICKGKKSGGKKYKVQLELGHFTDDIQTELNDRTLAVQTRSSIDPNLTTQIDIEFPRSVCLDQLFISPPKEGKLYISAPMQEIQRFTGPLPTVLTPNKSLLKDVLNKPITPLIYKSSKSWF